ncbi:MAG: efflux RND transporter periplasmic adaptor subunit, partial [Nitrospirota bacterium]|nr:efflux RND transporter periplasmic adaptor subunit [Nitrospirota bacterium]
PLTGTVVERNVTPGQRVGGDSAQVVFTVADLDTVQVVADVHERDLGLITLGQRATATVESWPGQSFPAVITRVGDIVDATTRTVKVRAMVKNEARKLKPEMFAQLTIPLANTASFIVIPQQAVVEVGGQQLVYVETTPGQYEPREIKVKKVNADHVRVLEGLTAGEQIVARGAVLHQTGGHNSFIDPLQAL